MEIAICKFCGQIGTEEVPKGATKEEALEIGTRACNCWQARAYQQMLDRAETAKIELKDMLLNDDEKHNIKAVPEELYNLLINAIDLMANDKIYKITVSLCSGGTVEIKANSGGKFSLKRSVAITRKSEV